MQIKNPQNADMERHERLRQAREEHFGTAKDAAASMGIPYQTYAAHEAGTRGIKDEDLRHYAKRFHKPLAWLAFGIEEVPPPPEPAIMGEFGKPESPDEIYPDQIYAERRKDVEPTLGRVLLPEFNFDTMAVKISGNSLSISVRNGWTAFFDNKNVMTPPFENLLGELCVCFLQDGRIFLKEIHPGKDEQHFDLESPNSPTIRDVIVEQACRVICLAPPHRGSGPKIATATFSEEISEVGSTN